MGLFLSTHVNKVDKKGRVSVPSSFRGVLGGQTELIVFRSLQANAIDACAVDYMDRLSEALDNPNKPDDMRDLIETTVFGGSVRLAIDPEGRIVLPEHFMAFAGITEGAAFVGRRHTFQIWDPDALSVHEAASRDRSRAQNISLSTILARTNSVLAGGGSSGGGVQ
ncbi:division/cell wall cluster transcriptional repressor MraZ [Azospirillum sp. B4]|uniref:division/cell wall cluster transcriptional repressor MraZ n=1 Tax=Azospirillum sp. B4 TaxID=95605 RepID=UPI0005C85991|nr:division/cell wall cluster transcriptional repressor MraZ [Azospirillum sp. B4]